ncbi:hypothetical protein NA57DRAFT_57379 [Rhizodiscina lignyota]|uniref:Zn(2)-C6 fungal-type domain-containing protein n=1 Tax=Rhizodiscina lignyota TaxID=1504668 RepID=A0A9P4M9X4_9PEZI|nr:hypothetical protein NA57DRAFT_57379 [Rhizodiscina lignyota]
MEDHMSRPPSSSSAIGSRRKVRKGTQSCTEWIVSSGRRRKIRCTYLPGSQKCAQCSARGARCVDQRDEPYDDTEEERKLLRERVARLEALLEKSESNPLRRVRTNAPSTTESSDVIDADIGTPYGGHDRRIPLVSVLDEAEEMIRIANAKAALWPLLDAAGQYLCFIQTASMQSLLDTSKNTVPNPESFAAHLDRVYLHSMPSYLRFLKMEVGGAPSARKLLAFPRHP